MRTAKRNLLDLKKSFVEAFLQKI